MRRFTSIVVSQQQDRLIGIHGRLVADGTEYGFYSNIAFTGPIDSSKEIGILEALKRIKAASKIKILPEFQTGVEELTFNFGRQMETKINSSPESIKNLQGIVSELVRYPHRWGVPDLVDPSEYGFGLTRSKS